jgi:putative endonuclease
MREPMRTYYVYILTNRSYTVLYVGMTNDLDRRVAEHRSGAIRGFASKYKLSIPVYVETTPDVWEAIAREKALKRMSRAEKNRLIESLNESWVDLLGAAPRSSPDSPRQARCSLPRAPPR